MRELWAVAAPSGTVTFLFTDIEGSTRLWQEDEHSMSAAVARHDELLREVVTGHGGEVFATMGDGLAVAFPSASSAVAAALASQRLLAAEAWPPATPIRVRMGLHTGEAERREGDYFGSAVNRAARLMAVGSGGRVLCSAATAGLIEAEVGLVDLGEHRLRDLDLPLRVFQVGGGAFSQLRSLDAYPGNLPLQLSSFVGRDADLMRTAAALTESRILTLTGVGGVGKTRLALQVAAEVLPRFADGAWLCELAAAAVPEAVVEVVAAALGVTQRQGQTLQASLAEFLQAKRLLLVLDNCEHLLDAVAHLVDEVVHGCPGVSVLATSREGLGVAGERIMAVPSLGLPSADVSDAEGSVEADAVRLFADRAADAEAGFMITDHNREHVVRLCRRLDGIPLAIELAAARVRTLTPAELADRLDSRFRLLASGPRTAVERHQTLRRAIDWSYDLLSDAERTVLNRLAVFAGSFTLAAAEGVVADDVIDAVEVIDLLGHLVDKSLLTAEHHERVSRYRLLETIRQYAQDRLEAIGEADAFRQRHAEYYASFSGAAAAGLRGADEVAWTTSAEAELDNLRAAVGWAHAGGDADLSVRLIAPLALNGTRIGYATGGWAGPALALPGAADHPRYPELQAWAAWAALVSGEGELAVHLAEEAVRAIDADPGSAASACCVLRSAAGVLGSVGRVDESAPLARRWAELARSIGDDFELSQALVMAGIPLAWAGRLPEALAHLDDAIAIARRLGNPTAITYAATSGGMLRVETEPARALELLDEALDRATLVGNQLGPGLALQVSADLHFIQGDVGGAIRLVARAVDHYYKVGDRNWLRMQLFTAVVVFAAARANESAAVLYGAAPVSQVITEDWTEDDLAARSDIPPPQRRFMRATADLRAALGDDRFVALADRGSHMNDDEVVDLVRQTVSPFLAGAQGDDHPGRNPS